MQQPIILQHPAHLWIANTATLEQTVIAQLQQILCQQHGCKLCSTCKLIDHKQHPATHWIQPDGSYTLDQIDEILQIVRFKLAPAEQRFIVFQDAQYLTSSCNNRLLKTIEEPHPGYFFIFLATRTENILPTLQSRCFLKEFNQQSKSLKYQEFMQPFLHNNFGKPLEFTKMIDTFEIKEPETKEILDDLLTAFHAQLQNIHSTQPDQKEQMLAITDKIIILKQALEKLPVSGSAKMFWKNLYLKFDCNR
ncbi:hypothetical protein A3J41_00170 [candidate division TM6 bacterium RIFCSPHIGHO2_12_FULL_38_8]|nr:MAG: hypothetical protein A3J41_00170 [candidate division TM6 bacterium RIFCSPHIGHO2_12_FULL_38_8]